MLILSDSMERRRIGRVWRRHAASHGSVPRAEIKTVGTARAITTALTLLRRMGRKIVEGFEHFAEYRGEAIAAVMRRRTE